MVGREHEVKGQAVYCYVTLKVDRMPPLPPLLRL